MYYVTYHSYSEIRRSPIQIELLDRYFQLEIIILNIKIKSVLFLDHYEIIQKLV